MKKFLIITSYTILGLIALIYATFLIAPPIINQTKLIDNFKPEVVKLTKEFTKLNLDYSKIKIYTTPLLSAGVIIENPEIKLEDNSTLFKSPKIKGGIALPSLLTLTIKTANTTIENPYINLEIINDEQYKILRVVEDIINEANAKPKQPQTESSFDASKIKIKVPSIKIKNYIAKITDLKTSNNLTLKGEELIVGYNSAKNRVKVKTNAQLLSNDNQNINANINFSTFIPTSEAPKEQPDPDEKVQFPFVNIVKIYQTYNLQTDIDTKLKLKQTKKGNTLAFGHLNVDNLTLKLSDIQLPKSYFHSKFNGRKIEYDSNLFVKENEKISLNGALKFGKKPRMLLNLVTDEIHFENLLALLKGLLDSLNIKNELALVEAKGFMSANTLIKTNFKKLKSQGSIIIKDGSFVNQKNNIGIKNIVANLLFDDNALNIKDTKATINGSDLILEGKIDNKSNTSIKINTQSLSLPALYNAFAPKELKKQFLLNSAILSMNTDIKGKLDNLNIDLNANLDNLAISDSQKTMFINNDNTNIAFKLNPTTINGNITNKNFLFNIPSIKTTTKINDLAINLDKNQILINPFDLIYNNISKINIKGSIENYLKDPQIDIFASGAITTQNLKQTLGNEISYYLTSKGSIPAKISIKGDSKKQDIIAQIYADNNNYITPINLNTLKNGATLGVANIKIQGNKIRIKDSGLYKKLANGFDDDLNLNTQGAKEIIELTSIIDGSHINLLRLNIPEELTGNIATFEKSTFKTKGKVILTGFFDRLTYGGDLKLYDIDIPEILFKTKSVDLDFFNQGLNVGLKGIDINNSKIDASLKADLKPAKVFNVSNIDVKSNTIDVDKALVTLEKLMKYMPPSNPNASKTTTASANIPLVADGKIDIKHLKTGEIQIYDIKSPIAIKNNDLILDKLSCNAFEGKINGLVKVGLLDSLITAKLKGNNINADNMLAKAANMKDTISGKLAFETDLSLKGATYLEQVKSLKGKVNFEMEDGQYGPFAKLENFFLAENIRENVIFKNTIGAILSPITTIDSTHYEKLKGEVNFKDGVVHLNPITSQGDILCILINGDMNLVDNTLNSNVRVRLASAVSDMLGPIAMANPVNLVKNTPGLNIATAKLFSVFTQVVEESEYKLIPDFSAKHSDKNATKFQIILNGDVAKPLSLLKSFKWLALQEDMDKATEFSNNFIAEQEQLAKQALIDKLQAEYEADNKLKVGVEKILQMDTTAPKVKEMLVEEVLNQKEQAKAKAQETIQAEKEKIETQKQQAQAKVQEAIEAKKQKIETQKEQAKTELQQKINEKLNSNQKLIDFQNQLKENLNNQTNTQ